MKGALSANRADEKRRFPLSAEDLGAEIGLRHVDEAARLQSDMPERLDIRFQRHVVVGAAGHVAPMRGRKGAPRGLLEIHDLQRVFRASDHGTLVRNCELLRPRANGRCEHGAGGEELKKCASVGIHGAQTSKKTPKPKSELKCD